MIYEVMMKEKGPVGVTTKAEDKKILVTSKRDWQKAARQHDKVKTSFSDNCEKTFKTGWSEGLCTRKNKTTLCSKKKKKR